MIRRFLDDIESIIGSYPAVLSSTLQKQIGPDNTTIYLKGVVTFTDLSVLEFCIFAVAMRQKTVQEKYRFQYMDKKSRVIFRYDNAPHHREISSFPHHKHLPDRITPAEMPVLADVLNEISTIMLGR